MKVRYVVRCGEYETNHSTKAAAERWADMVNGPASICKDHHEVVEQTWAPEHPDAYRGWVDTRELDAYATNGEMGLPRHVRCCRSVYRYWRNQGLSPADARVMVGSFTFSHYSHDHG